MNTSRSFAALWKWIAASMQTDFWPSCYRQFAESVWLRICCLIVLILTFHFNGYGQTGTAPYLGGPGDGYAKATAAVQVHGDPSAEIDSVLVFPTLVQQGEEIQVLVLAIQNELEIRVQDLQGRLLWQQGWTDLNGTQLNSVPTATFAAGAYLVEVRHDGKVVTRKILVQEE
jgi:hypothetical protein